MRKPAIAQSMRPDRFSPGRLPLFFVCIATLAMLVGACSPFSAGLGAGTSFDEANAAFLQGSYAAALSRYAQIVERYPQAGDRALFEMGIIHAHPRNEQKDYQQALECFQAIARDYPGSRYRQDSELMIFYLSNVAVKDQMIATQQAQIETLRQEGKDRAGANARLQEEIAALQQQIAALEQKVFACAIEKGPADRILIEKAPRRLTLIAKGEVLKTYRIALGGNPVGPKERQGDNKTPEGLYFIDAKNRDSHYHLSLRISYPNERDRRRAQELGASPGGNIMIHGIKNGFAWVGDAHAEVDWTKGCIAVTDAEIEEIDKLAPVGTAVEIRP